MRARVFALALVLAASVMAGCTASIGGAPAAGRALSSAPLATPTTAPSPRPTPTPRPTIAPVTSPTPEARTTYTPDDEGLAEVIRAGVAEALPELERLADMPPSDQVALFEPLGVWITTETEAVKGFRPSSCTADAVDLFLDGLDQYDEIRALFLAWKDWGAHGRAYAYGAPGQIAATLTQAATSLEASCSG